MRATFAGAQPLHAFTPRRRRGSAPALRTQSARRDSVFLAEFLIDIRASQRDDAVQLVGDVTSGFLQVM